MQTADFLRGRLILLLFPDLRSCPFRKPDRDGVRDALDQSLRDKDKEDKTMNLKSVSIAEEGQLHEYDAMLRADNEVDDEYVLEIKIWYDMKRMKQLYTPLMVSI